MELTKEFLENMISTCRGEQDKLRANVLKQEGVIAFCEMLMAKIGDKEPGAK